MVRVRKTGGHGQPQLTTLWQHLNHLANCVYGLPKIGNGSTAGCLRTSAATPFKCDGKQRSKASTDNLWSLSGEPALGVDQHRAYWLYVDADGTASVESGKVAASVATALAALPPRALAKAAFGVFVAGPSTDFTAALAAQGAVYDDVPAGAPGEFQAVELVAA